MSDSYIYDSSSESQSECEIDGNMVNNITPYNFEPKPITRSRNAKEKETPSLPSRANNKDWCKCAGYRQYTRCVHNHLGKGVRKVIPSCTIWAIRDVYPEQNKCYVRYHEARDAINA